MEKALRVEKSVTNEDVRHELKKEKGGEQSKLTLLYRAVKKPWALLWSTRNPTKEETR